jgi:hypothetical protein
MPGTRVRPLAGPNTSLVPGIHVFNHRRQDVDGPDIGEQSDAVLRTAMPGHDHREVATYSFVSSTDSVSEQNATNVITALTA